MNGGILLVEDNPDDVTLAMRAFTNNRVASEVVIARDGLEALERLHGAPQPAAFSFRVVLLDLKLPRITGLEVLRRIRAHESTQTLPVVILTSSDEERDLVESYRLGANSYIRKPVDLVHFTEAVRELVLYWVVLNLMPQPQGSVR